MRVYSTIMALVLCGALGAAFAADEKHCGKMQGQERASCEKQHSMGHDKMHEKGRGEGMRGRGAIEKGQGAEKGSAGHDGHEKRRPESEPKF